MPADNFQIIGSVEQVETIAIRHSIRDLDFFAAHIWKGSLAQAEGHCDGVTGKW
jgi:hypothetical protein